MSIIYEYIESTLIVFYRLSSMLISSYIIQTVHKTSMQYCVLSEVLPQALVGILSKIFVLIPQVLPGESTHAYSSTHIFPQVLCSGTHPILAG